MKNKRESENVSCDITVLKMQQGKQHSRTCRIPSLNHETFNVSMEVAAIVETTGTQRKEIL